MARRSRMRTRGTWMKRKDPATLRRARLRADLTQRELAMLCKVSQTTIYLLERPGPRGMNTCSEELAIRIAKRLRVDLEDLFEPRAASPMPMMPTDSVDSRCA